MPRRGLYVVFIIGYKPADFDRVSILSTFDSGTKAAD